MSTLRKALTTRLITPSLVEDSFEKSPRTVNSPILKTFEGYASPKAKITISTNANHSNQQFYFFSEESENLPLCTTNQMIADISNYIDSNFVITITTPYSFSDVKIIKDETHAVGVTYEGYCVYIELSEGNFEEVSLTKNALSAILLYKQDTMAIAKEKDQGKIYVLEIPSMNTVKIITIKGDGSNGIGRMCFTPKDEYLLARLWKGEILRWKVSDMDKYDVMLRDKNIACMNSSPDGDVIIGMNDKRLVIYNHSFDKVSEKTFDYRIDAYISFSKSGHIIILAMEHGIKVIDKKTLAIIEDFHMGCQSYYCAVTSDNHYIIAPLETGEIAFLDIISKRETLKIKAHSASITSLHLTHDQKIIYSFGKDLKIGKIKFPVFSHFKKLSEANISTNTIMSSVKSQEN